MRTPHEVMAEIRTIYRLIEYWKSVLNYQNEASKAIGQIYFLENIRIDDASELHYLLTKTLVYDTALKTRRVKTAILRPWRNIPTQEYRQIEGSYNRTNE